MELVNFPFLDGDFPGSPSYGVYITQLIRFMKVCLNVNDFNSINLFLTAKLLVSLNLTNNFTKFYHRHSKLIVKYNINFQILLQQGIPEHILYGDLVYKYKLVLENLF